MRPAARRNPHLIVGAGKEGKFYLIDRDNMGKFGTTDNIVQTYRHGEQRFLVAASAYFNGRLYTTAGYGGNTASWPLGERGDCDHGWSEQPRHHRVSRLFALHLRQRDR